MSGEKIDLLSFASKLVEKISDPSKTKEYYQSYFSKKTLKIHKTVKSSCSTTKNYSKPKHC